MSVCIQYNRPNSSQVDNEIYGFDVAVTNFLSAYFRYGTPQQFICRPGDDDSFQHFTALAAKAGIGSDRIVGLDPRHPKENLGSISCLFRPDPLTIDLIWRRQQLRTHGYTSCGLVHTMSGERITAAVNDFCIAPSDESDALICPSQSIRSAVIALWDSYAEYLNYRFGTKFKCPVQTPIIPLGIDCDTFANHSTPELRTHQRETLGATDNETIILFVGRLSFATKAHPLPLFLAAERAAKRTNKKTRLIMYGYFKPKEMEPFFRNLANDICKTVQVEFISNDDDRFPHGVWAAADIFTSLSDNVQESFGLTPIEAMASGLPCVISDWNGYREGVRNGSEGFLIPTTTPPPEAGKEIADYYYNENNYGVALAGTVQSTAIDIEWCAQAFSALINNQDMRRQFGINGRTRARQQFDWRHVIRSYEELWRNLAERKATLRTTRGIPEHWSSAHPSYPNPWKMFASFPTTHMAMNDILHIAMTTDETNIILSHGINYFVPSLLVPQEQIKELVAIIRNAKAVRIGDLLAPFPTDRHNILWRCIGWMVKHGVCFYERPPA